MGNRFTNFRPIFKKGRWLFKQLPIIASSAMEDGSALYYVGDGEVGKVNNSTTNFAGILLVPIAATDTDYATAKKLKLCAVPCDAKAEAEFAVGAGTFSTADIGKSVKYNDEKGLAVDTAGIQARITKYISSTRGVCVFNQDIV